MSFSQIKSQQETAQLLKKIDWSKHPLGSPEGWAPELIQILSLIMNSLTPMFIFWSKDAYCFYNDAYLPILGSKKHPSSLGQKAQEVWPETWHVIRPQLNKTFEGHATLNVDEYLPLYRDGKLVEGYFSNGYTPIYLADGTIGGAFIVAIETTKKSLALRQSEARFKQIAESLPQLVWTCLPDGSCDYLSKQWEEYTGMKQDDQLGFEWITKVIHPDDQARVSEHWLGAVKGFHPYDIEYRLRRYDGTYRWFKTRGTRLQDREGNTTHWFGTCTDIDETKEAHLEYERDVDSSPAMLWITDETGYCTYLSRQWYDMTGQNPETGLGYGWLDATHPDDKEKAGKIFTEANSKQTFFRTEYRLKNKDGQYRWAIDAGNPRFDKNGKFLGIAGTVFDVHERKLAEEEILNERENFRHLFKESPEMVCILKGPEHLFEFVNEAHVRVLGFDATGKKVREAQPESVEIHGILDDVYNTGKTAHLREIPVTVGTRLRYFDLTYSPRRDREGTINGVMILGTEITEQIESRNEIEKLASELQEAVVARDTFLSIASHELKTPLTSLKMQIQLRQRILKSGNSEFFSPEKLLSIAQSDDRQVNRINRLIDDMLDIGRLNAGKLSLAKEEIDLCNLVTEAAERLEDLAAANGSKILLEKCDETLGQWDRFRLEQVFTNLLTNAVKYGKGQPVMVMITKDSQHAIVAIQDKGIGISKEDQERIFGQFERAIESKEISGLGLGLYIVKNILEAHGGSITVESSVGAGATFIVKLPLS